MFRNILKPTLLTTSAISRTSVQRGRFERAKKSSIILVPILQPLYVRHHMHIHLFQLLIDLRIILVVFNQLDHQRAIRKRKKLTILHVSFIWYKPLCSDFGAKVLRPEICIVALTWYGRQWIGDWHGLILFHTICSVTRTEPSRLQRIHYSRQCFQALRFT